MRNTTPTRFSLALTVVLATGLGCSADTADLQPLAWRRVSGSAPGGALLGPGAAGAFDERANFTVSAFRDGSTYVLYYGGSDATGACAGINGSHWRVGLAESTDGVSFTRVPGHRDRRRAPRQRGARAVRRLLTYRPVVLKDGALYRMWYNGSPKPFNCPTGTLADDRRIGYAESTDGVTWTKFYDGAGPGGSVLPLGAAGRHRRAAGRLRLGAEGRRRVQDVLLGQRLHQLLAGGAGGLHRRPHLDQGAGQAGRRRHPRRSGRPAASTRPAPTSRRVVKEREQLYRMWYRGCAAPGPFGGPSRRDHRLRRVERRHHLGQDPAAGRRTARPSGRARPPAFDSGGLTTPSVFVDGDGWNMYYAGFDTLGQYSAGLARAPL